MDKLYIAVLGIYNDITTEETVIKEIGVTTKDKYEAHKQALYKCVLRENQTVLKLTEANTKVVVFNHRTGFA